jgi:hypothetical protein
MSTIRRSARLLPILLAVPAAVFAQSSASYKVEEKALNEGGRPAQAVISASASYQISLDSIGDPIAGLTMTGPSFHLGSGLAAAESPPGEVTGLRLLADQQTLVWSPERASTVYNVYSGPLSSLPGGFGTCAFARVAGTSAIDPAVPGMGTGSFYLVTGVNGLREEGTKGRTSAGTVRNNPSPCP